MKATKLAKNLKMRKIYATTSVMKIAEATSAGTSSHSPIQESTKVACNVNRKYDVTTASNPILED